MSIPPATELTDRVPTPDEVRHLRETGQVLLRDVISPEVANAIRGPIDEAIERSVVFEPTDDEGEVYRRAFDQRMNLWRLHPEVEAFVRSPALGRLAARLLGVERVRLYHDQALHKRAGGGHTPWHQDKHYWPLDTDLAVTMWMPLVDVDETMGELQFAQGTHTEGKLADLPISAEGDRVLRAYLDEHRIPVVGTGGMRAGDASFHLAWTLHGATPNTTSVDREVMTIIWFADGARVTEPTNRGQRNDLALWLPGCEPGDLAASELNPVCA